MRDVAFQRHALFRSVLCERALSSESKTALALASSIDVETKVYLAYVGIDYYVWLFIARNYTVEKLTWEVERNNGISLLYIAIVRKVCSKLRFISFLSPFF